MTPRGARAVALGCLATTAVAAVMLMGVDSASAQQPDVSAWWNSANLGDPAPEPPMPPDVAEGDLLVAGLERGAGGHARSEPRPRRRQAIAGLRVRSPTDRHRRRTDADHRRRPAAAGERRGLQGD